MLLRDQVGNEFSTQTISREEIDILPGASIQLSEVKRSNRGQMIAKRKEEGS